MTSKLYYQTNKKKILNYHRKWIKENRIKWRGYNRVWNKKYGKKSHAKGKLEAVLYKGGKCLDCGFSDLTRLEVFDFDHLGDKHFNICHKLKSKLNQRVRMELDLCELVCSNCHRTRTKERQADVTSKA